VSLDVSEEEESSTDYADYTDKKKTSHEEAQKPQRENPIMGGVLASHRGLRM
jgi:hypothetical protein